MKNSEIAPAVPKKLPFDRNVNLEFPNNNNQSNYHYFYHTNNWCKHSLFRSAVINLSKKNRQARSRRFFIYYNLKNFRLYNKLHFQI